MIREADAPTSADTISPALMTIDQASTYVGMSTRWVWREVSAGRFPAPVRPTPRTPRWRRVDLDAWVEGLR